ncbi:pro-sigmaK processing inhibitor BofA family protein [Syntrophomonas palmitatica]|uniref:pro-sigmaK processing inhibitor BofA family protein n=1 Tax=Syntrophomonas palmitatica TaxID=402877 RepID=UPI000A69CA6D|nr:pro-sigmaK processing inhibitor BofA family protein [Syntrophomonas palmitatica]
MINNGYRKYYYSRFVFIGSIVHNSQILAKPVKLLWKILLNSLIGLVLLLAANYLGAFWDFSLPVNIITVLTAGFLGIPGVLLLIAFKLLI